MARSVNWYADHRLWVEAFALVNLAFLGPDIYLAHSTNLFHHPAEYVPLVFSPVGAFVLLLALVLGELRGSSSTWYYLGIVVGWLAVIIGVVGLLWHLGSRFFHENTMESLVYTAPFAAPLAYTGIGLLVIMNRMVSADSPEWPQWVVLLALGGFVGNFIFSLADHAQNGFYHSSEWMPVASSALAVGFLLTPFLVRVDRSYLLPCVAVLLLQAVVGVVGFVFHVQADLHGPAPETFDNLVYGAPVLAPLLFPNLVLLAGIGLWVWRPYLPPPAPVDGRPAPAETSHQVP